MGLLSKKERAARRTRAAPARISTSMSANGSLARIIAQKKRRAKLRRRKIALLLILTAVFIAAYIITEEATDGRPTVVQIQTTPRPAPTPTPTPEAVEPTMCPTFMSVTPTPSPDPTPEAMEAEEQPAPRYPLSDAERDIVERVVMAESGGESFEGQMLVAQCILTAAEKTGTEPSQVVIEYKYAKSRPEPSESVREAVAAVFDAGDQVTAEPIMYFYAPARVSSAWHESQIFVIEVGGHRFFAERNPE